MSNNKEIAKLTTLDKTREIVYAALLDFHAGARAQELRKFEGKEPFTKEEIEAKETAVFKVIMPAKRFVLETLDRLS